MTPRGRAALVLGLALLAFAVLSATAVVHAGRHDCGSAISAHAPAGTFVRPNTQSAAEDQCDRKITGRRRLVAVVGGLGLLIAMAGAYDHEKSA